MASSILLRRSMRLNPYDSNGREYLADCLNWPRKKLETWIAGRSVLIHLQHWYKLCIIGDSRFNDGIDWINTGDRGYYYSDPGLEEDLLLMCLQEGEGDDDTDRPNTPYMKARAAYADEEASTAEWITQEVWARTAWRIVQANKAQGHAFEKQVRDHPAACYAFAIDLLCLAFHSIAHRGDASVWKHMISVAEENSQLLHNNDEDVDSRVGDDDQRSGTSETTMSSSTAISDHSSDLDFQGSSSQTTSLSKSTETAQDDTIVVADRGMMLGRWFEGLEKNGLFTGLSTGSDGGTYVKE